MEHVDENRLVWFLRGELTDRGVDDVEAHLDACATCRDLFALVASSSLLPPGDASPYAADGETSDPLAPGTVVGRYTIARTVGIGGMGVVYAARDPQLAREVAVKLLRPGAIGQDQLLREAQLLAQLSHPNVVAVHDAGTHGDQLFVAMELVDGDPLIDWSRSRPAWRDVLAIFRQVGEGIAAAHAAGVIHRDIKPANIRIGRDGRARILDFGLARWLALPGARELAGTPAYMSPEQLAGGTVDARSDQFSFCVALYETLYGERPFAGLARVPDAGHGRPLADTGHASPDIGHAPPDTGHASPDTGRASPDTGHASPDTEHASPDTEHASPDIGHASRRIPGRAAPAARVAAVASEVRVRPAPSGVRVPAWLRRVVVRGLATDPADRYPDMRALLAALEPRRARWLVPAVVGAAAVIGVAGVAYGRANSPEPCRGAEQRLVGVWDVPRRDAIHAAFRGARVPYAEDAFARLDARVTAYTAAWVGAHVDACEACRVRGEQSEAVLDRRMRCLDDRLRAVDALAEQLVQAKPEQVALANDAAAALPAIDRCADPRWLPDDDAPPALRASIAAVAGDLARVDALGKLGKMADAREASVRTVAAARALGHRPTLARALVASALADSQTGAFDRARASLREAVLAAEAGHDDATRVMAWLDTANAVDRAGKPEDGLAAVDQAAAIVERIGGEPGLAAEVAYYRAALHYDLGHYAEAHTALAACFAATERAGDPTRLAEPLQVLGQLLYAEGKFAEARDAYERGLQLKLREVGPDHPHVADALEGRATTLAALGRVGDAIADYRRALAIREAALGPDHKLVAMSLSNIADAFAYQSKFTDALPYIVRALSIVQRALGPDHPRTADTLVVAARIYRGLARPADARDAAARAVAIRLATVGPEHPDTARAYDEQGAALVALGDPAAAIDIHKRSLAILEKAIGPDQVDTAQTVLLLGEAYLAAKRTDDAVTTFERALAIREHADAPAEDLAEARFALARALAAAHRDPARARTLADAALAGWTKLGGHERDLAAVRTWSQSQR